MTYFKKAAILFLILVSSAGYSLSAVVPTLPNTLHIDAGYVMTGAKYAINCNVRSEGRNIIFMDIPIRRLNYETYVNDTMVVGKTAELVSGMNSIAFSFKVDEYTDSTELFLVLSKVDGELGELTLKHCELFLVS